MNFESPTGIEVTDGVASGNSLISEPSYQRSKDTNGDNVTYL